MNTLKSINMPPWKNRIFKTLKFFMIKNKSANRVNTKTTKKNMLKIKKYIHESLVSGAKKGAKISSIVYIYDRFNFYRINSIYNKRLK